MNPAVHECERIVTGTQLVNENDLNDLCLAFMTGSKRNMSKEHTTICIWAWHPVTALQIAHRRKESITDKKKRSHTGDKRT